MLVGIKKIWGLWTFVRELERSDFFCASTLTYSGVLKTLFFVLKIFNLFKTFLWFEINKKDFFIKNQIKFKTA